GRSACGTQAAWARDLHLAKRQSCQSSGFANPSCRPPPQKGRLMASLREIRRKIKSVKSTQQITKAMKMVAAARLRKAQARILSARPFAQKMEELMTDFLIKAGDREKYLLSRPREGNRRALLLVTSDRGL